MSAIKILSLLFAVQSPESYTISPPVDATATLIAGNRFKITWGRPSTTVEVFRSSQADHFRGKPVASVTNQNEVTVDGIPGQRTYFKLKFADGKSLTVADRFLHLAGADNFRDLGGYATSDSKHIKWGVLFRSNSLHDLTEIDKDVLSRELGLKEVFDLRGDSEVKTAPDSIPAATYTRLPIAADKMMSLKVTPAAGQPYGEAFLQAGYFQMVDQFGRPVLSAWLKKLAEGRKESTPSVLHCTAGKDRTGVAYAVLLSLLNVPRETILADYSLTNLTYPSLEKQFSKSGYPASFKALLLAYPNSLAHTLEHIDAQYGSVEKYALAIGVSEKDIQSLRKTLLE